MGMRRTEFPSQRGRLVVSHSEELSGRRICIYGDPEGLRSLGQLLIAEAELNQENLPDSCLPNGQGHQLHLQPRRHLHPDSLELVIGRLDGKKTGRINGSVRAVRMKRERKVVEWVDAGDGSGCVVRLKIGPSPNPTMPAREESP